MRFGFGHDKYAKVVVTGTKGLLWNHGEEIVAVISPIGARDGGDHTIIVARVTRVTTMIE